MAVRLLIDLFEEAAAGVRDDGVLVQDSAQHLERMAVSSAQYLLEVKPEQPSLGPLVPINQNGFGER